MEVEAQNPVFCELNREEGYKFARRSISDLTLHPAPGEEIKLSILSLDEMFNKRPTTVSVGVRNLNPVIT